MTGKLRLDQIPFGTLNNISDAGGPSTDRRRTDPLEFLRLSTEEAYGRDALANKDSFEGIVIATPPRLLIIRHLFIKYTSLSLNHGQPLGVPTIQSSLHTLMFTPMSPPPRLGLRSDL